MFSSDLGPSAGLPESGATAARAAPGTDRDRSPVAAAKTSRAFEVFRRGPPPNVLRPGDRSRSVPAASFVASFAGLAPGQGRPALCPRLRPEQSRKIKRWEFAPGPVVLFSSHERGNRHSFAALVAARSGRAAPLWPARPGGHLSHVSRTGPPHPHAGAGHSRIRSRPPQFLARPGGGPRKWSRSNRIKPT